MCGICGVIGSTDPEPTQSVVRRMLGQMHHRGPDDEGLFIDDSVALGMRRLSIIDLGGGHQPVFNDGPSSSCSTARYTITRISSAISNPKGTSFAPTVIRRSSSTLTRNGEKTVWTTLRVCLALPWRKHRSERGAVIPEFCWLGIAWE